MIRTSPQLGTLSGLSRVKKNMRKASTGARESARFRERLTSAVFLYLESVNVSFNGLVGIDASGCVALTSLNCTDNALGSLDIDGLSALCELNCNKNLLASLDLTGDTSLKKLYCYHNALESLHLYGIYLEDLDCAQNQISGTLDLRLMTNLERVQCQENELTGLNVSGLAYLNELNCSDNDISELNLNGLGLLDSLRCNGNALESLDATSSVLMDFDCRDNMLGHISVNHYGADIILTAEEGGYVELVAGHHDFYALAQPEMNAAFFDWTDTGDEEVSVTEQFDLLEGTDYDLTANFLSLKPSNANGTVYTGGRITLTPSIAGGTWSFDDAYLSRSGNQFTGLTAGTVRVTYTLGDVSAFCDVTVIASQLPQAGQNFAWVWALISAAVFTGVAGVIAQMRRQTAQGK